MVWKIKPFLNIGALLMLGLQRLIDPLAQVSTPKTRCHPPKNKITQHTPTKSQPTKKSPIRKGELVYWFSPPQKKHPKISPIDASIRLGMAPHLHLQWRWRVVHLDTTCFAPNVDEPPGGRWSMASVLDIKKGVVPRLKKLVQLEKRSTFFFLDRKWIIF